MVRLEWQRLLVVEPHRQVVVNGCDKRVAIAPEVIAEPLLDGEFRFGASPVKRFGAEFLLLPDSATRKGANHKCEGALDVEAGHLISDLLEALGVVDILAQ